MVLFSKIRQTLRRLWNKLEQEGAIRAEWGVGRAVN
jgi:hypothetical protein